MSGFLSVVLIAHLVVLGRLIRRSVDGLRQSVVVCQSVCCAALFDFPIFSGRLARYDLEFLVETVHRHRTSGAADLKFYP